MNKLRLNRTLALSVFLSGVSMAVCAQESTRQAYPTAIESTINQSARPQGHGLKQSPNRSVEDNLPEGVTKYYTRSGITI